jgi:hypothetical protein
MFVLDLQYAPVDLRVVQAWGYKLSRGPRAAGVATLKLTEIGLGMEVSWIHIPRGGYGFPTPVDAIVVRVCARRIRIEVLLRDGRRVERLVSPEALRPRYA